MRYAAQGCFVNGMRVRTAAIVTGVTYLLNPVTFAEAYAMPHLIAASPAQTVATIAIHPHLFSAAILCYAVSVLVDVVIAWSLYVLLAPINQALALLGSLLQLTYAAVWLAVISNLGVLYRLVCVSDYARQISPAELPTQAALLLSGYRSGWGLGLIFFGLHLVVTGWLMARSKYLPHWLGWLLFLDGWAWVADNLSIYLYPGASTSFLNVFFAVELIFMIWLLGWGWRVQEPELGSARSEDLKSVF